MKQQLRNLIVVLLIVLIAVGGIIVILNKKHYLQSIVSGLGQKRVAQVGLYKVTYVYDGDTIAVNMMGNSEKIRLIGVDTPETHDPDTPVQCYGIEASIYTNNNLLNKEVRLESDPTNQNRDRYDRLLRYVYLKDGQLWNKKLIEEGYGFAYLRYPFMKLTDFQDSELRAKDIKIGLWGTCSPKIIKGLYQSNSTILYL